MKLYIELLLSVSLTGTIPFCVYLLFKKTADTKTSAVFQYHLLKFCLLCFLFPFALAKSLLMASIFPAPALSLGEYVHLDNRIIRTEDGFLLHPYGGFYEFFIPLWIAVMILIISCQLYRYLYFRRKALRRMKPDEVHQAEFAAQKAQLGLRRHVSLLYYDAPASPFTCGFLHPCVVITSAVPEAAASMAIRHELQHIRSHDFLFRAAAFLAVLIHCWNPLIYLLWKEFCEVQELACDEKITASLSPDEVRLYGYSVVDISASVSPPPFFSAQLVRSGKKSVNRRILRLSLRFHKKSMLTGTLFLLFCLAGFCIPVLACSPEIPYFRSYSSESLASVDWVYVELIDDISSLLPDDELHFQYTDQYFILEDGSILDYPSGDLSSPKEKAACSHTWSNAVLKEHLRDSKGGCTVTAYNVTFCTRCAAYKNRTFINSNYYGVCPH